ncbi:methyltransferase domain-containing protein [Azospirillum melinis]|uniref:Methyltransferase domain-containing protein n=1 Tax=Azospirillum melinis TaxID=328839 RepID=A0ABX2KR81_9PROT|nr:class I SAM-dependent methyltransferase [Azospirillum melinis]MBP2307433.1 2-polyprenyl-6-hydroxyphenyl methylase/3-demethylubiquinone-9 3-methyltransferase [Azospirillum melinis]NUB03719.1 methyltransferase domain-containing protein [Azospirillum melinis]
MAARQSGSDSRGSDSVAEPVKTAEGGGGTPAGTSALAFDFGENWDHYSRTVLDEPRLVAAIDSLKGLVGTDRLKDASFCDVGSGSGLFTIAAGKLGVSRALGFDVNPTGVEVARRNLGRFAPDLADRIEFRRGSALDSGFAGSLGRFDVVYAWGSLHHTGSMWPAIETVAPLVAPGGTFVLALYNRHWTSPIWTLIKIVYNLSPGFLRKVWDWTLGSLMFLATWAITGANPLRKERGMEFWVDVTDWLGGYPYEYASADEVRTRMDALGFDMLEVRPPRVPTGCNEFILRRRPA